MNVNGLKKSLLSASLVAAGMFGASAPAHALLVSGSWDPAYGSSFSRLGWNGTAEWFIPDACVPGSGLVLNTAACSGGGMRLVSATVNFYNTGSNLLSTADDGPTRATLTFSGPQAIVDSVTVSGSTFSGITTRYTAPGVLSGDTSFKDVGDYAWGLSFVGGQARLAFAELEDDDDHYDDDDEYGDYDRDDDDHEYGKSGQECAFGVVKGDDCGVNDFRQYPANVTFTTPIPEPETYALMLAGLAAVGFMARRRRQV